MGNAARQKESVQLHENYHYEADTGQLTIEGVQLIFANATVEVLESKLTQIMKKEEEKDNPSSSELKSKRVKENIADAQVLFAKVTTETLESKPAQTMKEEKKDNSSSSKLKDEKFKTTIGADSLDVCEILMGVEDQVTGFFGKHYPSTLETSKADHKDAYPRDALGLVENAGIKERDSLEAASNKGFGFLKSIGLAYEDQSKPFKPRKGQHFDEENGKLTFDGVYGIFVDTVSTQLGLDLSDIKEGDILHDNLGADSLDHVEIIMAFESNISDFFGRFPETLDQSHAAHSGKEYTFNKLKVPDEDIPHDKDTVKGAATKIFDFLKRVELAEGKPR